MYDVISEKLFEDLIGFLKLDNKNPISKFLKTNLSILNKEKLFELNKEINELKVKLENYNENENDEFDILNRVYDEKLGLKKETDFIFIEIGNLILQEIGFFEKNNNSMRKFERLFEEEGLNVLIRGSKLSSGIDEFLLIDKNFQEEIHEFSNFSQKNDSLDLEIKDLLKFFVYYFDKNGTIQNETILSSLNKKIINELKQCLN